MSRREQIRTSPTTVTEIMRHPNFARGLADVRAGRPLAEVVDDWSYERGRLFGKLAPRSMPLFIGGRLNPKAIRLYEESANLIP
jgi:hypothetical protein